MSNECDLVPIIGGRAGERILKIVHLELDVHVEQGGITACRNGAAEGVVIDRNIQLDLECKPGPLVSSRMGVNEVQLGGKGTYTIDLCVTNE